MLANYVLRQYRRVYRYEHWIRKRFTVTGHLFIILLIGSGVYGVDTQATTTYQLFSFLLIIFISAVILNFFNRYKISVKRKLPKYATVEKPFVYSLYLTLHTKKKTIDNLVCFEQLSESLPTYSELAGFYQLSDQPWYKRRISYNQWRSYLTYQRGGFIDKKSVPLLRSGFEAVELKLQCTPIRRGRLLFSGCYLAKADLLGLFQHLLFIPEKQTLLVLPKRYIVAPLSLKGRRKYQSGGVSLANSGGDSSEFISLREYRQGDAINSIHWKSVARHGNLIVKEYQDEYFVRRSLLLDTFAGKYNNQVFEAAVSVAASIVMSERQNDALLDLIFVDKKAHRFTSGRSINHIQQMQEILAAVQKSKTDDFLQLHNLLIKHADQCSSVVCVLLHWNETRQQMIKQLTALEIPLAVYLVHDGNFNLEDLSTLPEKFYLIDSNNLAESLSNPVNGRSTNSNND